MASELSDKVREFNKAQKYTQKQKNINLVRTKIDQIVDSIGSSVKNFASNLAEIPNTIKERRSEARIQAMKDQHLVSMYQYFLQTANNCTNKTGVEHDPEFKNIKVIYTTFGPLYIATLDDFNAFETTLSRQVVEGFLPSHDGLLRYFDVEIQIDQTTNESMMFGRSLDPETLKTSYVEQPADNVLFYIKKQEETAIKESQSKAEQEK